MTRRYLSYIFVTPLLWRFLYYPLRSDPVYRILRDRDTPPEGHWPQRVIIGLFLIAGLGVGLQYPLQTLIAALALAIALPMILIIFNGTTLGTLWVGQITQQLVHEQRSGRFDLLALTPRSALGVSWLAATTIIHHDNLLPQAYRIMRFTVLSVLLLLVSGLFFLIWNTLSTDNPQLFTAQLTLIRDIIALLLLVSALWLDHVQSITLAVLVGIAMPTAITGSLSLPLIARFIYLTTQIGTYTLTIGLYLLLQTLSSALIDADFIAGIVTAFITLLGFLLLREVQIGLCWRWLITTDRMTPQTFVTVVSVRRSS